MSLSCARRSDAAYDELFENHLAFLATHRGRVTSTADWVRVDGHADFLSSWTPLHGSARPGREDKVIRLLPGDNAALSQELAGRGYAPAEALSYMELPPGARSPACSTDCRIEPVGSAADAKAFAEVQAAAFLDSASEHRAWWTLCFRRMAVANHARTDQDFLIAWAGARAAAVLLAVDTAAVAGVYAVATRPRYQRQGLSTALLHEARSRARDRGRDRLALQAVAGSYAQGFYRRLGFVERYVSRIWRRPAS